MFAAGHFSVASKKKTRPASSCRRAVQDMLEIFSLSLKIITRTRRDSAACKMTSRQRDADDAAICQFRPILVGVQLCNFWPLEQNGSLTKTIWDLPLLRQANETAAVHAQQLVTCSQAAVLREHKWVQCERHSAYADDPALFPRGWTNHIGRSSFDDRLDVDAQLLLSGTLWRERESRKKRRKKHLWETPVRADNLLYISSAVLEDLVPNFDAFVAKIPWFYTILWMYHILIQNSDIIIICMSTSKGAGERLSHYRVLGNKVKIIVTPKKSEVLLCYIKVDKKINAKRILHQGCGCKGRECNKGGLEEILIWIISNMKPLCCNDTRFLL